MEKEIKTRRTKLLYTENETTAQIVILVMSAVKKSKPVHLTQTAGKNSVDLTLKNAVWVEQCKKEKSVSKLSENFHVNPKNSI